jgi:para-nitrobenzyl esterase
MNKLLATALLAIVATGCTKAAPPAPNVDPSSRRTTASGPVVGAVGDYDDHAWRGIPYAAAPVGALRWRAPQPAKAWTETREALSFGSPCTQFTSKFGGVPGRDGAVGGSEDCLHLNVYAPRFAPDAVPTGNARLPVMVWIHGGGNTIGQAGFFNGGHLAVAERVIVVTINYRLGPFGWLRHAALRDGATPAEQSGNFGTLDQIAALTWVRDNIAAFGGDPGNVTIFGESAGGRNVFTLLLSPPAKGLYHRAIVQSGGLYASDLAAAEHPTDAAPPGDKASSGEAVLALLQTDGTAADRAVAKARAAAMSAGQLASYLRGKSAEQILRAYAPQPGMGMIEMPQVFPDGVVLPEGDAMRRFAAGDYNQVPVMLGTTRDENKLFMFGDPKRVQQILWIYPRIRDERMYNLSAEYVAKMWKATGADEPAAAMRGNQDEVFVYRFDWDEEPSPLGANLSLLVGASHGFEIPFVFGHFDLGSEGNIIFSDDNEPGRVELSQRMMGYWAQFARTGDPGRGSDGSLPLWEAWNPAGNRFVILDTDAGGGVRMSPDSVTAAGVLAALDADPRLTAVEERCSILGELAKWSSGFNEEMYAGRAECQAFPLERTAS